MIDPEVRRLGVPCSQLAAMQGVSRFGGFLPAAGPLAEGFGVFLCSICSDDDKDGWAVGGEESLVRLKRCCNEKKPGN